MHILVTRPKEDGPAMQDALRAHGIQSSLAPTLNIHAEDLKSIALSDTQAVAITSRNALKSVIQNGLVAKLTSYPVFAVGAATRDFARSHGLTNVQSCDGTARALVDRIVTTCDPKNGFIHHIRGAHVAFDVKTALEQSGFVVHETTAYRSEPATHLPDAVVAALKDNKINGVILMSPRSAKSFASLLQHHNIAECCNHLHYFCLSDAVGTGLRAALPIIDETLLSVPSRPTTEELLALVARFAANYCQTQ